jgi:uncharacterized protein YabN with tetrapyrrole methylase and pyrophosphatase domain
MDLDEAAKAFGEFVSIIKALRTPGSGCPWDLEQTHQTLRPYLLEEAHEVLDALDRSDDRSFQEELGDLLLQLVLHAQVAADRGAFTITEVIRGVAEKMVRRHPHVFGSVQVKSSAEVARNWEQIKAAEKLGSVGEASGAAAFDRIPESLPALPGAHCPRRAAIATSFGCRLLPHQLSLMDRAVSLGSFTARIEPNWIVLTPISLPVWQPKRCLTPVLRKLSRR